MTGKHPTSWLEYALMCVETAIEDKNKARALVNDSSMVGGKLLGIEIELNRAAFGIRQEMKGEKYE